MAAQDSDEFLSRFEHRINHLRLRKDKMERYKQVDPESLNSDQRSAIDALPAVIAKLEQIEDFKEKYIQYLPVKHEKDQELLKKAAEKGYEDGLKEGRVEVASTAIVVTSFLKFITTIYTDRSAASPKEIDAVYALLQGFYAGDESGAQVIAKLVEGADEDVTGNGITYKHIKRLIMLPAKPSDSDSPIPPRHEKLEKPQSGKKSKSATPPSIEANRSQQKQSTNSPGISSEKPQPDGAKPNRVGSNGPHPADGRKPRSQTKSEETSADKGFRTVHGSRGPAGSGKRSGHQHSNSKSTARQS